MKGELKGETLHIGGLRLGIKEAQAILLAYYPALLEAFVVKTTVEEIKGKTIFDRSESAEVRHVDWQGCLLDETTKAILFHHINKVR